MAGSLNGPGVRDKIIEQGIQDTSKGALTMDSGKRAGTGIFKASKDFAHGDAICGGLCSISAGCEVIASILVWCPIPGKITTVAVLKCTSIGC